MMSKKCLKRPEKDVWRRGGRGECISCCTPFSRQWGTHPQLALTVRVLQSRAEASRFSVAWRQLSQVWGFLKSTQNDHWDMSDPMSLPCASHFPPSSPNALRSTPSLSASPRTTKHDGERGGLVPSPLPVCPAHHSLGLFPKSSTGSAARESSPPQSSSADTQLAALRPSFTHAPGQRASSPSLSLSRGLGKGGHCAKQATGIRAQWKETKQRCCWAFCPQDRASLAKPSSRGGERGPSEGTKGKAANAGVHASLSSGSLPHPPWSPTALQAQLPRLGGNRTRPLFSLLTRTSDPAANFCSFPSSKKTENRPGSPQGLLTHHGTLCLEQPLHPTPGPSLSQIYQASTPLLTKTVASLTSYTSEA